MSASGVRSISPTQVAGQPASSRHFNELRFADLQFRAAPGRLVPYFAVTLMPDDSGTTPVCDIMCGPRLEVTSMDRALGLAQRRFQYEKFRIRCSKLQLR